MTSICMNGDKVGSAPIISFAFGVGEFLVIFCLTMIVKFRLTYSSRRLKEGVTAVLPIYFYVMSYSFALGIVVGIDGVLGISFRSIYGYTVKWILLRSCLDAVSAFLLHNGIGYRAMKNSIISGIIWGVVSGAAPLVVYELTSDDEHKYQNYVIASVSILSLLFLFYLSMWLTPLRYLHRRPALINYSIWNLAVIVLLLLHYCLTLSDFDKNSCPAAIFMEFSNFLQPLIIIVALRQDSLFWQGLYSAPESNLNEPVMGIWDMGRETITMVADSIAHLERKVVPMLPYASLQVDTSKFFSGGTARVYKGQYKQHQVAIKFLFSIELTPEKVINFCDEATILNSLQHPNVVQCFGVAVMPPALCLVTEFCNYGSLYDFIHFLDLSKIDHVLISANRQFELGLSSGSKNRGAGVGVGSGGIGGGSGSAKSSIGGANRSSLRTSELYYAIAAPDVNDNDVSDIETALLSSHNADNSNKVSSRHSSSNKASSQNSHSFRINNNSNMPPSQSNSDDLEGNISSISLRSAESVVRSAEMGYGFGLGFESLNAQSLRDNHGGQDSMGRRRLSSNFSPRSSLVMSGRNSGASRISLGNTLPLALRLQMARDAAAGVAFLHLNGMMHCDIKSLNFLVGADLCVKLADLGEARQAHSIPVEEVNDLPRTLNWSSPEIIVGNQPITHAADVWSLAMVLYEIFTGDIPFDAQEFRSMSWDTLHQRLKSGLRPELPKNLIDACPWLSSLMESAWAFDPQARISAREINETIAKNFESLCSMEK